MPILTRRTQIAAKLETTEGTKIALAAEDAFLAFNPVFTPSIEMHARSPVTESLSKRQSIAGRRSAKLAFDCEFVGTNDVITVPPYWGKLMKACGYTEDIGVGVSVQYYLTSNNQGDSKSLTLAAYMDGVIKRLWGARGNVKLTIEAGKPGILHFEFEGIDFETVDGAMLAAPTYSALIPPAFLSATFQCDTYASIINKVEFDTGNTIAKRVDINSSSGYKVAVIANRSLKGSFDPELPAVADYNIYEKWKTPGTLGTLTLTAGEGAGGILTVMIDKIRHKSIADGERDGLRNLGIDFEIVGCPNEIDDFLITIT